MCVILVCPNNARPDLDTLKACYKHNPHGAGIAWREGGEVRWLKTNDVEEIHRLAETKRGEIVIHFRIASVGGTCDELRHPFPVSKRAGLSPKGNAKAVLFQNGTWSAWKRALDFAEREGHPVPDGEMSDARAAAFLCSIYGRNFLEELAPSRWVFFGAKGTSIFGDWKKIGGILYSNDYWKPCEPRTKPKPVKRTGTIPEPTESRRSAPMELWDMSASARYWDVLSKLPKPRKA